MIDKNEELVVSPAGGHKGRKLARASGIDPEALWVVSEVFGYGAQKYSLHNYLKVEDWSLYYDAALRHLMKFWAGEDLDPESGLHHLGHAASSVMMLLAIVLRGSGQDTRPPRRPAHPARKGFCPNEVGARCADHGAPDLIIIDDPIPTNPIRDPLLDKLEMKPAGHGVAVNIEPVTIKWTPRPGGFSYNEYVVHGPNDRVKPAPTTRSADEIRELLRDWDTGRCLIEVKDWRRIVGDLADTVAELEKLRDNHWVPPFDRRVADLRQLRGIIDEIGAERDALRAERDEFRRESDARMEKLDEAGKARSVQAAAFARVVRERDVANLEAASLAGLVNDLKATQTKLHARAEQARADLDTVKADRETTRGALELTRKRIKELEQQLKVIDGQKLGEQVALLTTQRDALHGQLSAARQEMEIERHNLKAERQGSFSAARRIAELEQKLAQADETYVELRNQQARRILDLEQKLGVMAADRDEMRTKLAELYGALDWDTRSLADAERMTLQRRIDELLEDRAEAQRVCAGVEDARDKLAEKLGKAQRRLAAIRALAAERIAMTRDPSEDGVFGVLPEELVRILDGEI